ALAFLLLATPPRRYCRLDTAPVCLARHQPDLCRWGTLLSAVAICRDDPEAGPDTTTDCRQALGHTPGRCVAHHRLCASGGVRLSLPGSRRQWLCRKVGGSVTRRQRAQATQVARPGRGSHAKPALHCRTVWHNGRADVSGLSWPVATRCRQPGQRYPQVPPL